ncbi:MAG TPA: DUF1294 domain-containing protein [Nitrososphaerales archaeon]|nr:DUF1294 domain-containing protein [Nitrososphaerales archaeon]
MFECLNSVPIRLLVYWLAAAGLVGFLATMIDKARAVYGESRIPEKTILFLTAVGGFAGVLLAFFVFRHKIHKPEILLPVAGIALVWLVALAKLGILAACLGAVFS